MDYEFSKTAAIKYGAEEAIMIAVIQHAMRVTENGPNRMVIRNDDAKNYRSVCIKCSAASIEKSTGFWTKKIVSRLLHSLESQGAIKEVETARTASSFDKSKWFIFADDSIDL